MNGKWTPEKFKEFDEKHPEIYEYFEKFALIVAEKREYYSAKCIFHRVRWETMIKGEEDYKIDDGWISHYARKFMDLHPEHSGFFKTRSRKNSYHNEAPKWGLSSPDQGLF